MRISTTSLANIAWYLKPFFWWQKKKYGMVLNPALVWAKTPKLFIAVASLYGILDRKNSPLAPELRSLITVRISQINDCRFCIDINSAIFLKRSASIEKCLQLEDWHGSALFSDKEKVALEYAEKITYSDQKVDGVCFIKLQRFFSENAIIELTALIAFQNMSSKFNNAFEIEHQGFCNIKNKLDPN